MKRSMRALTALLAGLMLLGTATACQDGATPTESDSTAEATDTPVDTETEAEPSVPEAPRFQTGELTLEAAPDLFPDVAETESWVESPLYEPEVIRVEAEDYTETTISFSTIRGEEYGGGTMMYCVQEAPKQGWDYTYAVSYRVTAPHAGSYRLTLLGSDLQKDYTSDYFIDVNGERVLTPANKYTVLESFTCDFDSGLFKVMDLGMLTLAEGENVITFTVDNDDSRISWNRISFFLDYFKLAYESEDQPKAGVSASYAVLPTGEGAENLLAARTVNVFDRRYPILLKAATQVKAGETARYTVTDYFGNIVYEGTAKASADGWLSLDRTVKNHPTGYFLLTMGDMSLHYVVVSPATEDMPADSPFAMDFAAYYLVKDPEKVYALTGAARMAGVTWVRERADWKTYEPVKGQYDFTSTEEVYRAIDEAGMNLLVMLCSAPSWATDPLNPSAMAGGFLTSQKDIYNTAKTMTAYYEGVVDAWELWNESDWGFALETAELYTAWYKTAALGVYDANPNATISFGGLCQPHSEASDYMHLALLNDLLSYSSVFNYHAHVQQGATIPNFSRLPMVSTTYGTLNHYNTANTPVWLTEAGMWIGGTPTQSTLKAQAPYAVTSAVQSLSMGTDKHFWFILSPYRENGGDFGTFSEELQPYPSLAAQSTMTHVLGKGQYMGELCGMPVGAYGYVFDTGSRAASVLWADKTTSYTFEAEMAVIITDLMGNQTLVKPEDGRITVELGVDPIFITYSEAPAYQDKETPAATPQPLQLDVGKRVIVYPEFVGYDINDSTTKQDGHKLGASAKVRLHIVNLNSDTAVSGRVDVQLEGFAVSGCESDVTVPAMDEVILELTLQKTASEKVDAVLLCSGVFNDCQTSRAAARVYSDTPVHNGALKLYKFREGKENDASVLESVSVKCGDHKGTAVAYVNGAEISTVSFEDGVLTLDLSSLEEGRHTVMTGLVSSDGVLNHIVLHITYLNGKVIINT